MNTERKHFRNNGQIDSLTGIRGVTAIAVFFYHAQLLCSNDGRFSTKPIMFSDSLWAGVDLFFILSGYVLMYAHQNDFVDIKIEAIVRFLTLRFWRIYPVSIVCLILVVILVCVDRSFFEFSRGRGEGDLSLPALFKTAVLGTHWLPIRGNWNGPTWSISVELIGYLCFPALAFLVARSSRRLCLAGILVALSVFAGLSIATHRVGLNDLHFSWALFRMAIGFGVGACLQRIRSLAPASETHAQARLSVVALLTIFFACLLPPLMILMEGAFALLIYSLASEVGMIDRSLRRNFCMFLGKVSFPFYLLHLMPMAVLIFHMREANIAIGQMWTFLILYCAICVWASYKMHIHIEVPFRRFGRSRALTIPPSYGDFQPTT